MIAIDAAKAEAIARDYASGMTFREVCAKHHVAHQVVSHALGSHGIRSRKRGGCYGNRYEDNGRPTFRHYCTDRQRECVFSEDEGHCTACRNNYDAAALAKRTHSAECEFVGCGR